MSPAAPEPERSPGSESSARPERRRVTPKSKGEQGSLAGRTAEAEPERSPGSESSARPERRRAAPKSKGEGGSLAGRTAIVTGGGRGIGAAVAAELTRAGAQVTVFGRTAAALDAVVAAGHAAHAVGGDVAREEDVVRLVAEHERRLGPCDLLVNNAGILRRGAVDALAPADWRLTLDVNLTGPFLLARAVLPAMKRRQRGRIVNVASISGTLGTPEASAYNASKWGLIGFTKSLAEELRPHHIACLSVSPGAVDTDMLKATPFAPAMTAEEVARVVRWCAAEAPFAMTGTNVEVFG